MENILIGIYDGVTDTYIEREATEAEQIEIEAKEAATISNLLDQEVKSNEKLLAKNALLEKLNITTDEAALLLS